MGREEDDLSDMEKNEGGGGRKESECRECRRRVEKRICGQGGR